MKSKIKIIPEKTDDMAYQKTNEDFNREKPSIVDPVQKKVTNIQTKEEQLPLNKTISKK